MKFETNRQMRIFYIILESDHPVTSRMLADITKVSVRTVKEDIQAIRAVVKPEDIELASKAGIGYFLSCDDAGRLSAIRTDLMKTYRSLSVIPTEFLQTVNYIVRCLLAADGYVKLEDLAEQLFFSRHKLAGEMRAARSALFQYKIQVISKPGRGIKIQTDEYHFRLCAVDYFEFFYHKTAPFYSEPNFLKIFEFDYQERLQVRTLLLESFRSLNIAVPDFCSQKLVIHLLLAKARIRSGKYLNIPKEEMKQIRSLADYKAAAELIRLLQITCPGFEAFTDNETAYLAVLLAAGRDYFDEPVCKKDYAAFGDMGQALYEKVTAFLAQDYGIKPEQSSPVQNDLIRYLTILCMKLKFDIQDIQSSPATVSHIGRTVLSSPFIMEITSIVIIFLEEATKKTLCEYDILALAGLLSGMIEAVPYTYETANFIIAPESDKASVRSLAEKLRYYFGDRVGKTDIYEAYQLRAVLLKAYDARLSAHRIPINEFPLPLYHVNYFLERSDRSLLMQEIFLKKYDFWSRLPQVNEECIYENCAFDSAQSFLSMFSCKYCKNKREREQFLYRNLELRSRVRNHVFHSVLVLCHFYKSEAKTAMDFYSFSKPLLFHGDFVEYAVVITADTRQMQLLKALEVLARYFEKDKPLVQAIIRNPKTSFYAKIFEEELRG